MTKVSTPLRPHVHLLPHLHECALAVCDHAVQLAVAHAVLLRHNPAHVALHGASTSRQAHAQQHIYSSRPRSLPHAIVWTQPFN
jgi:hypothetical protein